MSEIKLTQKFTIKNKLGLHARAAAVFVRLTSKYESTITVKKGDFEIDGKSILGVLSLAAVCGTEIVIELSGSDSQMALAAITELIDSGFGEGVCE
ncbi:MAG: HPr family phosphocarrier protein [Thermodesulfobacteriota bacterium]